MRELRLRPIEPLRGPAGMYNVSVWPKFLCDSARVGWRGAYFTSIVAAPEGQVDQIHERYCVQRIVDAALVREAGSPSWKMVQAGVRLWQPGDELRCAWRGRGRSQFLFIAPEHVEQVLECVPPRLPLHGSPQPAHSPTIERIFDALNDDLLHESQAGALVGDGLIVALIAHLAGQPPGKTEALGVRARDRVIDYIDVHLAQPLTLIELAQVAGVGVRQFSRSFRAATGESPHQFLLGRRIALAQRLIAQGCPFAQIAGVCGFADQSQFTRTFVRRVGATPSQYRAGLAR